jgi:hypothetical protein
MNAPIPMAYVPEATDLREGESLHAWRTRTHPRKPSIRTRVRLFLKHA